MGEPLNCASCTLALTQETPWIRCEECEGVGLCVDCFRRGREQGGHQNCHAYSLCGGGKGRSLEQELDLLSALERCGYGNWEEVVRQLPYQSTAEQARQQYGVKYVGDSECRGGRRRAQPFPLLGPQEDPPRPGPSTGGSARVLAGYNPVRGDFVVQYDNKAETLLAQCPGLDAQTSSSPLWKSLCLALTEVYNSRLVRRRRVERLMKELSLLHRTKVIRDLVTMEEEKLVSWGPSQWTRLCQVFCAADMDMVLTGLIMEARLKQRVLRLQQFRSQGLKLSASVPVFEKLLKRRQEQQVELEMVEVEEVHTRRAPLPLDIVGLPGYSSLCQGSRDLCSELRLAPSIFLEAKTCLKEESRARGGLRLAEARQLLKIDVNRTRRVYDFLLTEGLIVARDKEGQ